MHEVTNMVQPTTLNAPNTLNALKEYTVKASVRDSVTKKLLVITSKYEAYSTAQALRLFRNDLKNNGYEAQKNKVKIGFLYDWILSNTNADDDCWEYITENFYYINKNKKLTPNEISKLVENRKNYRKNFMLKMRKIRTGGLRSTFN